MLPLAEGHFSSEADSGWWGDPTPQSHCGGNFSATGDIRGCGAKPRT